MTSFYFVVVNAITDWENSMWDFILLWLYEQTYNPFIIQCSQMSIGGNFSYGR